MVDLIEQEYGADVAAAIRGEQAHSPPVCTRSVQHIWEPAHTPDDAFVFGISRELTRMLQAASSARGLNGACEVLEDIVWREVVESQDIIERAERFGTGWATRCEAITYGGRRCLNSAYGDSPVCCTHRHFLDADGKLSPSRSAKGAE